MDSPPPPPPQTNSQESEEASSVVTKLAKLSGRSSFASFFCKSKVRFKTETGIKPDPLGLVSDKTTETFKNESDPVPVGSVEGADTLMTVSPDISMTENETIDPNLKADSPIVQIDTLEIRELEPVEIKSSTETESTEVIISPTAILIDSDSSSSDSDIQLLSTNRAKRSKRSSVDMDIECISISSDDVSTSIPVAPVASVIPLTDYTGMKPNVNFFRPPSIIPAAYPNMLPTKVPTPSTRIVQSVPSTQSGKLAVPLPVNTAVSIQNLSKPATPNTTATSTSPAPASAPASQVNPFASSKFDPSLMDELMTRLSQKPAADKVGEKTSASAADAFPVNIPCLRSPTSAIESVKIVTFLIIQRLNASTFDVSKSPSGHLTPSKSFQLHWKPADTFGAMKQLIAKNLNMSQFELVLVNSAGHSELFDTTKPATLNINGTSLQEITARHLQAMSAGASGAGTAMANANAAIAGKVSTATARPAAKKQTPRNAKPSTPNQALANLQESSSHRLFLYTKASWALYKSLNETKKRHFIDSVSFLQSAEAEMPKYQETQTQADDDDNYDDLSNPNLPSEILSNSQFITLNVKTAQSKSQSFPLKLSSSAKVSDILAAFSQAHPNQAAVSKVIFDGDTLKLDESIDGILEDDDMIEIK